MTTGAAVRAKGLRVQGLAVRLLKLFCVVRNTDSRTSDAPGTPCKKWGVSSL